MMDKLKVLTWFAAAAGLALIVLAFLPLPWVEQEKHRLGNWSPGSADTPMAYDMFTMPQNQVAFRSAPHAQTAAASLPTIEALPTPGPVSDRATAPVRIRIAALDIDAPIVDVGWHVEWRGTAAMGTWDTVRDAVGHHRGSADAGQWGNCVLSGHSSEEGGAVFRRLDEITVGQQIELYAQSGQRFDYIVGEVARLDDTAASGAERRKQAQSLEPTRDPTLTLVTCWPAWAYTHRLVVRAKLEGPWDEPIAAAEAVTSPLSLAEQTEATEQTAGADAGDGSMLQVAAAAEQPMIRVDMSAPAPCIAGLVVTGIAEPSVAGPGDSISMTVRVSNVGAEILEGATIDCLFPQQLEPVDSDCIVCDWLPDDRHLTVTIDPLAPGGQTAFQVQALIGQDVWPGRTLVLLWRGQRGDDLLCTALTAVELPWAALPQAGQRWGGAAHGD